MPTRRRPTCPLILLAVLLPVAPAWAAEAEEEAARLAKPESTAQLGLGLVSSDNQRFGQYSGLRRDGGYLLFDADLVRRDNASGTWLRLFGRNLGLDSRELRFEHSRQGDWGYFIDFGQTPRFDPFTVRTRLLGVGTTTQTVNGNATAQEYRLKTDRKSLDLGFDKLFAGGFGLQLRFRNEEKDGARLWGQGDTAGGTTNFLTDPINQTARQMDAVLSYTGERLQLSGGYYGTWFTNHNLRVTVAGGIAGLTPMALPPDNRSHQFNLAGGFNFTSTTRATFKVAYGRITQNDMFADVSILPRTSLEGRVDTKLLQLGLTARPLPKLSLLANWRYDDRRDRTPIFPYLTAGIAAGSTLDGTNEPRSIKVNAGKLEASYALPLGLRAIGGLERETRERNGFRVRSVSHRDQTDETTWRAELRRALGETVNGALGVSYSDRSGSQWLNNITNGGATGSNHIAPLHLADRERKKVRLTLDWAPLEEVSLQFRADGSNDRYDPRSGQDLGLRRGKAANYALDGSYAFSEKWQLTGWVSYNDTRAQNASLTGTTIWAANTRNEGSSGGLGVRGKPRADLTLGADLSRSVIRDGFLLNREAGAAAVNSLPFIHTKMTTLKLYAAYALKRDQGLRFTFVHDRFTTDDWTWANWTYSDGTTVRQTPNQTVNFIGAAYYLNFQ